MTNTAPDFGSPTTLDGHPTYTIGDPAVILDVDVQIHDAEFDALGNYDGATLTLERAGGPNADDTFTYAGFPMGVGATLYLLGNPVATVLEDGAGTLVIEFNNSPTQSQVDLVMQRIGYANIGSTGGPVQIDWTFEDNDAADPLFATGSTTVDVYMVEPPSDPTPPIVTSIVADQPAVTAAHTINYTVTFSEPVTNVDIYDFGFAYDGTMSGLSITDVVSQSGNAFDTTWIVTLEAGLDPGWVQLDVNGIDVMDAAGNYLAFPWGMGATNASNDGRAPDNITGPFYITTGDVNGDGFIDVVTSNPNDNRVAVLLGDGTGSFTQGAIYDIDGAPLGQGQAYGISTGAPYGAPQDVILADLDGDGDLDMAVAVLEYFNGVDVDSHSGIAIRWNDGSGDFGPSGGFDYYEGVGEGPRHVVAGDLDNDGDRDLVVANSYDGTVSIMLSDGAGSFSVDGPVGAYGGGPYGVGAGNGDAFDIKVGDVDGDGDQDIIGINAASRDAFVLLNNGDATFAPVTSTGELTTTGAPRTLDVGDVNGDGIIDAVVAIDVDNQVQVLLGNGNGTFTAGDTYAVGDRPWGISLGDINGDGRLDIAVANRFDDTITLLHGIGDGTFVLQGADANSSNPSLPPGSYPTDVAMADINQDGAVDLIVPGYHSTDIFTLMGQHVNYASPVVTIIDNTPPVAVGDAATTNEDTAVTINVLANDSDAQDGTPLPGTVTDAYGAAHGTLSINPDGTITYTPAANYFGSDSFTYEVTDADGATATATVDVTVNSVNDPPVANTDTATTDEDTPIVINVLGNDSDVEDGTPLPGTVISVSSTSHGVASLNPDGTITYTPDANYFGSDSFTYEVTDADNATATATVDVTVNAVNDAPVFETLTSDIDIVLTNWAFGGNDAIVALGNGDGTAGTGTIVATGGSDPYSVALGDVNNDGNLDIVTSNWNGAYVALGNGDGTFAPGTTAATGGIQHNSVELGDVNGDGNLDIVASDYNGAFVALGNGDGTFGTGTVISAGGTGYLSVALGDVNGDGNLDIVTVEGAGGASVVLGNGDGSFGSASAVAIGGGYHMSVALGDVDGDGNLDIVAATSGDISGADARVAFGNGNGTFGGLISVETGATTIVNSVVLGDVDNDGNLDIVTSDRSNGAGIALGNGDGTFAAGTLIVTGGDNHYSVALGDLNADGNLDIVVDNTDYTVNGAIVALGNGDGSFGPGIATASYFGYQYYGYNHSIALGDLNPAPAIQDSAALSEDTASVSGVLAFNDVDLTDMHTVATAGTYTGTGIALGTLAASLVTDTTGTAIGGRIAWTYTLDTASAQSLAAGETKVETFEVSLSDGTDTVTRTVTVTIEGTNDAPVLIESLEAIELPENTVNAGPRLIAKFGGPTTPTLTDVDSTNFDGGQIAFRWAEPTGIGGAFGPMATEHRAENELSIRGIGPLDFDGTNVIFGGLVIGTVASSSEDGRGGHDLVIDLTADATAGHIITIIRNVTYQNTSDSPQASRLLTVQVSDGDGGTSTLDDSFVAGNTTGVWQIDVLSQNDPRSGTMNIATITAIAGAAAQLVADNSITDPDLAPGSVVETHWQAWNGAGWDDIGTGPTLDVDTVTDPSLINRMLRAVAHYSDEFGTYDVVAPEQAKIGSAGIDVLFGTAASDLLAGLDGNDKYIVGVGDRIIERTAGGIDLVQSALIALDLQSGAFDNVENAMLLGSAGLDLWGNAGSNRLTGNAGDNRIDGRGGADIMAGRDGNDTYVVDDTTSARAGGFGDLVSELVNAGTDTVEASVSYRLRPNVENLDLTGFDAIDGTGNTLVNVIVGNDSDNVISGRQGNDILTGGGGADHFVFNTGFVAVTNIDQITDFETGMDRIELLSTLFVGTGAAGGTLSAAAFHIGTTADAGAAGHLQRIIYDDQTGALYYDRDGSGSRAQVQFAQLDPHLVLTYQDFAII